MTEKYGALYGHHMISWLEAEDGLIAVDTGWDMAQGEPYEGSDVAAIEAHATATGLPLRHLLITHDHRDHQGNLPFLRERWPELTLYAHPAGSIEGIDQPLIGGERLTLGGIALEVIASPGHSEVGDELSFYLPDERTLFCGDVAQPQGPSYSFANGVSPVPYFHDGAAYRDTLTRLIALDAQRMRSGHGAFLGPEQLRQWLRVTLATVTRIEELALDLVDKYADRDERWLAELLYEQLAEERHFGHRRARERMRTATYPPQSDFERFDLPGILDTVGRARAG